MMKSVYMLRDTLFNLARSAHLAPRKEEVYLLDGSAERPADILLPSWSGGRDLCVDVSVVSPFVSIRPNQSSGAAAQAAEQRKMAKYERRCEERNLLFMPFILETTSGFGSRTEPLLRRLAVALADVERLEVPVVLQRIRQQVSFTVQRAMAEGFLMREETLSVPDFNVKDTDAKWRRGEQGHRCRRVSPEGEVLFATMAVCTKDLDAFRGACEGVGDGSEGDRGGEDGIPAVRESVIVVDMVPAGVRGGEGEGVEDDYGVDVDDGDI